jgi:hypothetical protein
VPECLGTLLTACHTARPAFFHIFSGALRSVMLFVFRSNCIDKSAIELLIAAAAILPADDVMGAG